MLGIFKKMKKAKVDRKIAALYQKAINYQRNGKIKEYSQVMAEIESLDTQRQHYVSENSQ